MSTPSIKKRFSFTIISNILRGGLSFLTGLIVARSLGPKIFGDVVFLIGSFVALRQLLDLGTSNAFFTFLSNRPQGLKFLMYYMGWQIFQFLLPVLLIGFILPEEVLNKIWLRQEREAILLCFMAVFMKEQAWNTMVQLGESNRLTYKVQFGNILIASIHFLIIAVLWKTDFLSIKILFILIFSEYLIAIFITTKLVYVPYSDTESLNGKILFKKYYTYCLPLILSSLIGFFYEFTNLWMLQKFGGSEEQAFYGIGFQFAAVGILVAISLKNVIWQEIAEAHQNQNLERLHILFKKASRFLYLSGAFFCSFLIFWSEEIIKFTLGNAYVEGSTTLTIMLLYPIHQSLGQLTSIFFYATNKTRTQLAFHALSVTVGLPFTYFLLAPKDAWIPGLELGSIGTALQMVILQFIIINLRIWWIDKTYGWNFDWHYQIIGLGASLALGYLAFNAASFLGNALSLNLMWNFGLNLILYCTFTSFFLWNFPWVAGLGRNEIRDQILQWARAFSRLIKAN